MFFVTHPPVKKGGESLKEFSDFEKKISNFLGRRKAGMMKGGNDGTRERPE